MLFYFISIFFFYSITAISPQNTPDFNKHRRVIKESNNSLMNNNTGGNLQSHGSFDSTLSYGKKLLREGVLETNDSIKLKGELTVARAYININRLDSATIHLKEAISMMESKGDYAEKYFSAKNQLGVVYSLMREWVPAKNIFKEILDEREFVTDPNLLAGVYTNLANLYRNLHDYEAALKYYELALKGESTNNLAINHTYLSIGNIYVLLGKYKEADDAYLMAINSGNVPGDFKLLVYNARVANFKKWNKTDSAEVYIEKAYNLAENTSNPRVKIQPYLEMAELEINRKNFSEAESILNKLRSNLSPGNKVQNIIADYLVLKMLVGKKQYDSAVDLGEKLIEKAKKNKLENYLRDSYLLMAESYDSLGNLPVAYSYIKLHTDYLERMKDYHSERVKRELEARFESNKLKEKLNVAEKGKKFSYLALFVVIVLLVIILFLSSTIYKKYKAEKLNVVQISGEWERERKDYEGKLREIQANSSPEEKYLLIDNKKIDFDEIIFVKASGHYLYYTLKDKKSPVIERRNLKDILSLLPKNSFVQIHRSHIINFHYLKQFTSKEVVLKGDITLPLSRTYKPNFLEMIKTKS